MSYDVSKQHGFWPSEISAKDLATKTNISELKSNSKNIYSLLSDPGNKNRQYLISYDHNRDIIKLTDSNQYNIKSGINEYGGGSYWLSDNYIVFFNKDDGNLYKINLENNNIKNITGCINQENQASQIKQDLDNNNIIYNYSDGNIYNNYFIAIREVKNNNNSNNPLEIKQTLTSLDPVVKPRDDGVMSKHFQYQELILYYNNKIYILDKTHDFYSFPRISPDGKKILWLSWEHPDMPWDKSVLYIADLDLENFKLNNIKTHIDIDNNSLFQPEWIDNNRIFIVSEHDTGCWDLYYYDLINNNLKQVFEYNNITNLNNKNAEMGLPLWGLGVNTYCFNIDNNIINLFYYKMYNGQSVLYSCNLDIKNFSILNHKLLQKDLYIQYNINVLNNKLYYLSSDYYNDLNINYFSIILNKKIEANKRLDKSSRNKIKNTISTAQHIEFKNSFGMISHAFYYEPIVLSSHESINNKKKQPPLIVICHGGPTGTTNIGYNTKIQYWTTRGFAVVDVNYSGSTTYGREYRERLKHNWGIIDVDDCVSAAKYLIDNNKVDKNNIFIKGSSAGGYTVLTALYKYNVFTAGCCYYPVSDLLELDQYTHKFEKYYNNYLIGDYETNKQEYIKRSPISFADGIKQSIIIFHGELDPVVNIKQTEDLFNLIKNNNINNKFYIVPEEGHGFRQPDNIKFALDKELEFYQDMIKK